MLFLQILDSPLRPMGHESMNHLGAGSDGVKDTGFKAKDLTVKKTGKDTKYR